jgi:hypothetical protein
MDDPLHFTIEVSADVNRFNRYRWTIVEAGKVRDRSVYNFATRREAQADAEKFVEKLIFTWKKEN